MRWSRRNRQFKRGLVLLLPFLRSGVMDHRSCVRDSRHSSRTQRTPTYAQLCPGRRVRVRPVHDRLGSTLAHSIARFISRPFVWGGTCPVKSRQGDERKLHQRGCFWTGTSATSCSWRSRTWAYLFAADVYLLPSDTPGWFAFKTTWIIAPSYQGPIIVRAKRIDGPGPGCVTWRSYTRAARCATRSDHQ